MNRVLARPMAEVQRIGNHRSLSIDINAALKIGRLVQLHEPSDAQQEIILQEWAKLSLNVVEHSASP